MVQDRYHLTPVDYAQINGQDLCFNYLNEVIGESVWRIQDLSLSSLSLSLSHSFSVSSKTSRRTLGS